MHGTGIHHHIQKKNEWNLINTIREFFTRFLGHHEHENIKQMFDKFIAIVGLIGPIMTTPQIINVWIHHQVEGLALSSWGTYVMTSFFWLIYGILHKEKAIILVNVAWILAHASIVVGILIFR